MKTRRFHSHATSPGIAIGKAFRIQRRLSFPRYWLRDREVTKEVKRLRDAVALARDQLAKLQAKLCRIQGNEQIKILETHRLILQDDMLLASTIRHIETGRINAEWALDKTLSQLKLSFLNIEEEYLRERRQDIEYVGKRVMENLLGITESSIFGELPKDAVVLVAHDLSPAEVVLLSHERISGFIMETGGETSHTAILSRAFEIPALFGVKNALDQIADNELIIIDGMKGLGIASPIETELRQYRSIQEKYHALEQLLLQDIHLPSETKDGFQLELETNIEFLDEIPSAKKHGASGVGLYRTEFLFLNRLDEPSESEQFENYSHILESFNPQKVTIRTIDLGGEKLARGQEYDAPPNPALGLRAIRLCLKEKSLFKTQLTALLKASHHENLRILIPLVSHLDEVFAVKRILSDIKKDLLQKKIPVAAHIPLGVMIEVPSAVIMAEEIAREVDFFAIGTNDLLQYSLAIDRSNESVGHLYTPYHPALFRLLNKTVEAARLAKIPVSVCGEIAADPLALAVLVGLGVDSLSMNPVSIPRIKKIIRAMKRRDCQHILKKVLNMATADEVESFLRREVSRFVPTSTDHFGIPG